MSGINLSLAPYRQNLRATLNEKETGVSAAGTSPAAAIGVSYEDGPLSDAIATTRVASGCPDVTSQCKLSVCAPDWSRFAVVEISDPESKTNAN
jgi:hypothetical protein